METKLISEHLCRVFAALRGAEWQTAKEVKAAASVSLRTASNHLQRLVAWGVAEVRELSPEYRYRLKDKPDTQARKRIVEIEQAASAISSRA
jgi:predicted ArsR family transcriptional regulator